jgi:hypothetical protein
VTTGDVNRLFKRLDEDSKSGKTMMDHAVEEA